MKRIAASVWTAVTMDALAGCGPQQVSDLTHGAQFIFKGTVLELETSIMFSVPAMEGAAVVTVDDVLQAAPIAKESVKVFR